jgi:hypothetical protein
MEQISPTKIRYLKLGAGGGWEAALDRGRVEWGSDADAHVAAQKGDWEAVSASYACQGLPPSTVTGYTNEARVFFDDDPSILWITFARGRLWWTFAAPHVDVTEPGLDGAGAYYREALGGWRDHDLNGNVLEMERLSTRLTRLAGYRRTICSLAPDQEDLCRRYINAVVDSAQAEVAQARAALRLHLTGLLQRLSWSDFEQLVDLALARSGWTRVSALGGTGKDIDLLVEQPLTRERMAVQVKSSATQQVVDDYARRLGERAPGQRSLLICHSPAGLLKAPSPAAGHRLELLVGAAVSDLAINTGLVDWIVERAR